MNNNYSVIFDGQKVPDHELFGVKQRLRELFKADQARIEALFNGKPATLKRNLSRESAIKYQHMLKKAGVEVSVVQVGGAQATPAKPKENTGASSAFSLAPVGSDLIPSSDNKPKYAPSLFRTDHFDLAPQEGNLLKPEEREKIPVTNIDADAIDWELSQKGEDLLKENEKTPFQEAIVDTSSIDFDDSTKPLSPTTEMVAPLIKTEHLQLLPVEKTDS